MTQTGLKDSAAAGGLVKDVLAALDAAKAKDIVEYDVSATSSGLFDRMVICTAGSDRHARALAEAALASARCAGFKSRAPEAGEGWVLLDMGLLVVHIMSAKARAYYDLEGLWEPIDEKPRS
ncbi:MAG: ribosome silencing factor [Betaproteobacteria bacterium]|nr:ribosome silencing factor [Betaproteobacteria bacterium]